jgi:hypothetical protein
MVLANPTCIFYVYYFMHRLSITDWYCAGAQSASAAAEAADR